MELVLATGIGGLVAAGVWLLLRERTFPVVLGLALLSYAANLFIFAGGRLTADAPPLVLGEVADGAMPGGPAAAGAGAHRHRHLLRHHRLPRRPRAALGGGERDGPRGWREDEA
jgi:hypothetical protein